jgi:hypothetical protein
MRVTGASAPRTCQIGQRKSARPGRRIATAELAGAAGANPEGARADSAVIQKHFGLMEAQRKSRQRIPPQEMTTVPVYSCRDRMKLTRQDGCAAERSRRAVGPKPSMRSRELDGDASASGFKVLAPHVQSRHPETPDLHSPDVMFNALRTGDLPCTWTF